MTENPTVPGAGEQAPGRKFHPAAELFPLLSGAAFDELVADIRKNGLREPILADSEGRILDGRNRYRACLAAGVEPRFSPWDEAGSPADLSMSLNLHRRHLDESQRAMVAARLAKMLEKEAVKRKSRHSANLHSAQRGKSSSGAAAVVNVSTRLVTHAIKVLRDGCAELIAAVESGELAVSTAASLVALPSQEQAQVVAGGAKEIAARVRRMRSTPPPSPSPASRSLGTFGVLFEKPAPEHDGVPVAFLWVASSAVPEAVEALQQRGFRFAPPEK